MKLNHSNSLTFLTIFSVLIASVAVCRAASVKVEAESGTLGAEFAITNISSAQGITTLTDGAGNNPVSAARVATYSVTFPEAGTYDLFARVYVGPLGGSDDSFFYGNGFGTKTATVNGDWILMNNLNTSGYTGANNVVTNNGTAGNQVWKWVNVSDFSGGGGASPITFTVAEGSLTQTFQIGARENGLAIDALVFGTSSYTFTVAQLDAGDPGTPPPPPPPPMPRDLVAGNLIQFNDNGAWTWYSDERAIIDVTGGKLVVGVDASGAGTGGSTRNGGIEATIFDLQSATSQTSTLFIGAPLGPDDHNGPAFMLRPDGKYLAQWTGHNNNYLSYFSIYNGNNWEATTTFDWATVGANGSEQASYSNPHYLSAEDRTYTFVRAMDNRSPQILVSTNYGDTWSYYGKLVRPSTSFSVGYNPGYFRYSDNGVDRIDFICTEAHPRDYLTSIYHGYVSNGMSFKTDGTLVDGDLANTNSTDVPFSYDFTPVFTNGTIMPPGQTNYRCWNDDVQLYPDGTINCIISSRINQSASQGYPDDNVNPDHAFFFCRYDGTNWTPTYLCQAGKKMYSSEGDYVGLGAVHPTDPNVIYVSTPFDPRAVQPGVTDTNQQVASVREIWKGVTTNHGASFTWTPITRKSVRDNFRPIVPRWNGTDTAVLWFRGTYNTAQSYDAAVVGLVERPAEIVNLKTYVDATTGNTTLSNGSALVLGGSSGQWHNQTAGGNGGSVLSSADSIAENAPALKTHVDFPVAGTYDVWVDFWGNPGADWRIVAGLTPGGTKLFRQMACKEIEPGDHVSTLTTTNPANYYLYQAYLGRVSGSSVDVFVDDNNIVTGTTGTTAGNTVRTWYDGVSYAQVNAPTGLPYDVWIAGHGLSGFDAVTNVDYDMDGLPNAVEFVLGGNPKVDDASAIRPTYNFDSSGFEYDYRRTDVSRVVLGYEGNVYYSTDLINWAQAVDGVNGVVITEQNDFYGAGVDKVSVQLPNSLAAGGQLFVRFGVSPLPGP